MVCHHDCQRNQPSSDDSSDALSHSPTMRPGWPLFQPAINEAAGASGFAGCHVPADRRRRAARQRCPGQRDLPEADLELDVQFGQGLPRRECIGEESDEFRVTATCRQFGN
jgi:hypothetical protein